MCKGRSEFENPERVMRMEGKDYENADNVRIGLNTLNAAIFADNKSKQVEKWQMKKQELEKVLDKRYGSKQASSNGVGIE